MLEGSTLGVHAWNETVKGVSERAWVAERALGRGRR
jgi:hypothetical protein